MPQTQAAGDKRARKAREREKRKQKYDQPVSQGVCNTYKEHYRQRVEDILAVADRLYQAKLLPRKYTDPARILNAGVWFSYFGSRTGEEANGDMHLHSVAIYVSNGIEKGIPVHGDRQGFDSDWHVNDTAARKWMNRFNRFEKQFYRRYGRRYTRLKDENV